MSLRSRLAALIPSRAAKYAIPLAILAVAALIVAALAVAALVSPSGVGISAARIAETQTLPDGLLSTGLSEKDSDHDGLSDSLENYLYGTSSDNWNSSGMGIPDGWLVQYGFDPLSPLTKDARGAAPPAASLPPAYKSGYPTEYTPPLSAYYAWNMPASYQPGVDDPWWRAAAHADPTKWDQAGSGIPTGWLLHYGLDPANVQPDRPAPGAKGNLTLREAYEHNTDPRVLDTDKDGLTDWEEIYVFHTDPAKFSTARTGIADGWLVHYGLNPFDTTIGGADPDLDGLTNLEEFVISYNAFRPQVEAEGLSYLFKKGLDPTDWQTAKTGIPDGWSVRYGLSPFGADADRVIARSSDFPELKTWTPPGAPPLPDVNMTVRDAYEYGRPSSWNESTQGVWWGGTNPATGDTDGDGLPDVIEIRGWYANVTEGVGRDAKQRTYLATSNPLAADSDADGLMDLDEYRGRTTCWHDVNPRTFPPTNPRARDTAFSGLTDLEKVCGVVRGSQKYDLANATSGATGFDPTKPDSAGDSLTDGARLQFWHDRYLQYLKSPQYPYPGSAYKTVFEWTDKYARFGGMSHEEVLAQFRPDGDVDGDGIPNVLDKDASGGLFAEKFAKGAAKTAEFFSSGPKIDPTLYRFTEFASPIPHPATDPANPDTDGDGLPDAWEIRYGVFDARIGGWNLDPTKADSDGNGVTDDKENLDGDVVTWYSYKTAGSGIERETHTFDFNVALEYAAGTDPNTLATQNDGVPDGWKAFWGSRVADDTYPNLVAARDPRVGDLALAKASEIESAIASSGISPDRSLKGMGAKATGYFRFAPVSSCAAPESTDVRALLRTDEQFDQPACFAGTDFRGDALKVARIAGVYHLTYKREAELRTNPYVADTDGDGAPDAYEAFYSNRTAGGSVYPDPVMPDDTDASGRLKDPDGDGLGVKGECASVDGGKTCAVRTFTRDGVAYGAGTDPNAFDTDHDGVSDGTEAAAALNGLDPTDAESFRDSRVDTDHDGIPDAQELTGWGKAPSGPYQDAIHTDPKDPDTDHDGLLDGNNTAFMLWRAPFADPAKEALRLLNASIVEDWCSRGIAHNTSTRLSDGTFAWIPNATNVCAPGFASKGNADLRVTFLGEATFASTVRDSGGFRPDVPTSSNDQNVPDGWVAYYQPLLNGPPDPKDYNAFKPAWWTESRDGVWWCGRPPGSTAADLDNDGLHDKTGEDTFPAMRRGDNFTVIAGGKTQTITSPDALGALVAAATTPDLARSLAQRLCEGSGDPAYARAANGLVNDANGIPTTLDRASVAVLDLALPRGPVLTKGVAFPVTGRVVLDERFGDRPDGGLLEGTEASRVGVANRTVLVGFFAPSKQNAVVGVGFTNATGDFNVSANLSSLVRVDVPPGLWFAGVTNATTTLPFDPTSVAAGDVTAGQRNVVVAWVLNSSATQAPGDAAFGRYQAWFSGFSPPQRVTNATAFAVSGELPVTIHSDTRFVPTLPPTLENGAFLVGELKLQDASGAALADRPVKLRWTGAESPIELANLSTDREGVVNVTNLGLVASVRKSDQYALIANFTSSDPNLAGTGAVAFPVTIRQPTALHVTLSASNVTVGDSIALDGTLGTKTVRLLSGSQMDGTPIGAASLKVTLGGAETIVRTDDKGAFTLRLPVPGTLAAGPAQVVVAFAGSDVDAPARIVLQLDVLRTARIEDVGKLEGPRSISVTLHGHLLDNEGLGFAGPIRVQSGSFVLASAKSDDKGAFNVIVPLGRLTLGAQTLRVVFPGDAGHAPAENLTQARITSTTTLVITDAPDVAIRGTGFTIHGQLLDDAKQPVAAQAVSVSWRGARVSTGITDDNGEFAAFVQTNASARPADASLGVESIPPPTSVYQATSASSTVRVLQGVVLELGEQSVARGPIAITGRLLDDEARPLPAIEIALKMDGDALGKVRTGRNGSFEMDRTLASDRALGAITLVASYDGSATLARAERNVTWHVRSPILPELKTLGPFVRGEQAPIDGRFVDDAGVGVTGDYAVTLAGRSIGSIHVLGGTLRASLALPADLQRGDADLVIKANATDAYDAFHQTYAVVVKIRPKVDVQLPQLAIRGFSFGGDVKLVDDKGQPLRNTSFAYVLGKDSSAVVGTTDADGKAQLAATAPLSGDTFLALTVRGGNDVVAAEYRTDSLRVIGPATPIGYATLILGVLAVLVILAIVVVAALLRRRQLEEVREILEEAIRDLLAGNEYAGTIFLAYRRLSAHLARHGFAEKATDTPREFATGVRKALPVGAAPLRELIRLFEEAKYSDHAIGTRERDGAVESLSLVRSELDRILGKKNAGGSS